MFKPCSDVQKQKFTNPPSLFKTGVNTANADYLDRSHRRGGTSERVTSSGSWTVSLTFKGPAVRGQVSVWSQAALGRTTVSHQTVFDSREGP